MKVLQLCNKPPYPPVDGGSMGINFVTQGLLGKGCKVKVLTVESDKHPAKVDASMEEYRSRTAFESVYVDLGVKFLPAMTAMLCGQSYHVQRYISQEFAAKLREVLEAEEFDIVHVESIFMTPYVPLIRKYSNAKVVMRAHNVEHLIWKRLSQSCSNPLKKWYFKHLSLTLRAYELEHVNDYDGVVCVSGDDAEYFRNNGCRKPLAVIPFGIKMVAPTHVEEEPDSLFHLGAMDWLPNQEGVDWMLEEVWPVVHAEVPRAKLYLAGRKMPERLMGTQMEGVSVVGEVPDAVEFIGSKKINVVPLLSGSGIRVKIIEAMSVGKTVVTTTVGAEGIDYTDGENILIANTPKEFAMQIKRCLDDDDFCRRVGEAAKRLVADHYEEGKLAEKLLDFYNERIKL